MKPIDPSTRIIDCDVHCNASLGVGYRSFVPESHQTALAQSMATSPGAGYSNPKGLYRSDCECNGPEDIERYHLDRYGITYAVLQPQPTMDLSLGHSIELGNVLARAANDWLVATYLERDPRYLGSICINANDPPAAAKEIERMGDHPQMVQVLVPGEASFLYGHRFYHPIYQACEAKNLVFAIHPGREGSYGSSTPVGRPSTYFEWHVSLSQTFMAHTTSLILEGTFEKFPGLKVLLTEGGYGWLAHLMWRMDKNFKALRSTTPWLRQEPSAYALEHVKLTTQPLEEPANPNHALQMMEMIGAEKTLCFSSDYPHWDFDDPVRAFPAKLPAGLRQRILWDNAYELYHPKLSKLCPAVEEPQASYPLPA